MQKERLNFRKNRFRINYSITIKGCVKSSLTYPIKAPLLIRFLHTEKIPGKLMIVRMDIANLLGNSNPLSRVSFDFRPCYPVLRKYEHHDAAAHALVLLIIFKCRLTRGSILRPSHPSLPQILLHPRQPDAPRCRILSARFIR